MSVLLNAVFSLLVEGYMLSTGYMDTRARTTGECAERCLADKSCVAFFYNRKFGLCQVHNFQYILKFRREVTHDIDTRCYALIRACPKGYTLSRDPHLCYRISRGQDKRNHDQAMIACENDGGYLMRIDSKEKQEYVAQILEGMADVWIDGTDEDVEDMWRFADGTLMNFTLWARYQNQPDHDGNCVRLHGDKLDWFDSDCERNFMYICETETTQ